MESGFLLSPKSRVVVFTGPCSCIQILNRLARLPVMMQAMFHVTVPLHSMSFGRESGNNWNMQPKENILSRKSNSSCCIWIFPWLLPSGRRSYMSSSLQAPPLKSFPLAPLPYLSPISSRLRHSRNVKMHNISWGGGVVLLESKKSSKIICYQRCIRIGIATHSTMHDLTVFAMDIN